MTRLQVVEVESVVILAPDGGSKIELAGLVFSLVISNDEPSPALPPAYLAKPRIPFAVTHHS